jgi:hypothetical protein
VNAITARRQFQAAAITSVVRMARLSKATIPLVHDKVEMIEAQSA